MKILKRVLIIIVILFVILAGIVFGMSMSLYNGDLKSCLADIGSNLFGGTEIQYVLIMGVSEDISTELTDTVMVAGYNPDTNKAFLVSIPRDTFVGNSKSSASASDKINAQYRKGVEYSIDAVEDLTGLEIDGYVVIKTSMLVELVDLIGGVEFDVPIDMDYDDPTQDLHIHLTAGTQVLDGDQAEQLLRFRHNNDGTSYPSSYGDNDYGRMKTQRDFMKAVAEQTLSLGNIFKINSIINTVYDNLDTSYKTREMLAYAFKLLALDTDNLATEQIPGDSQTINKVSFFLSSDSETKSLINGLVQQINTIY